MNVWTVVPSLVVLAVVFVVIPVGLAAFFYYRYPRLVRCPLAAEDAVIRVDARRAGLAAAVGAVALRVTSCTFWPDRLQCGQACLAGGGATRSEKRATA